MASGGPSATVSHEMRPPAAPPDPRNARRKRGRHIATPNASPMNTDTDEIETSNLYDSLADNDTGDDFPPLAKKKKPSSRPKPMRSAIRKAMALKPPPLIIKNVSVADIDKLISTTPVSKNNVQKKLTQHGIKLFASTNDDFNVLKKALEEQKNSIHFFTYATEEERMLKFVLYGLPDMATDEIQTALEEKQVKPIMVKKMQLKTTRYQGQANYVVYYLKKSGMKIQDMLPIRGLLGYVVKWAYFSVKTNSITQCSNCQEFGHGSKHCFMPFKCMKCSGAHESSKCPLNSPDTKRIPDDQLKCVLCGGGHSARYKDCPKRLSFMEMRQNLRSKIPQQKQRIPRYINSNINNSNLQVNHTLQPTVRLESIASVLKKAAPVNDPSADLYSSTECVKIFNELFSALSTCRTKADQIYTLTTIALKYIPAPSNNHD